MIGILDYGGGNIKSVRNALERIGLKPPSIPPYQGGSYFVSDNPVELEKAEKIIFPGQGRAGDVMNALKAKQLDVFLKNTKKPFLGICVGMQVLFDYLEEDDIPGLGIIPGKVIRFDLKKVGIIPHMGWNKANYELPITNDQCGDFPPDKGGLRGVLSCPKTPSNSPLSGGENSDFYFVHSYYCIPKNQENVLSETTYKEQIFCSSVQKENFLGVQFHPEKSGKAGEEFLKWFCYTIDSAI